VEQIGSSLNLDVTWAATIAQVESISIVDNLNLLMVVRQVIYLIDY